MPSFIILVSIPFFSVNVFGTAIAERVLTVGCDDVWCMSGSDSSFVFK
ncbi:hypothetical protein [Bacteroides acidifaciens]|nr:hypothetical protein [Bacteroides acidifaciens]